MAIFFKVGSNLMRLGKQGAEKDDSFVQCVAISGFKSDRVPLVFPRSKALLEKKSQKT